MSPTLPPDVPPGMPQYPYDVPKLIAEVNATLGECGPVVDSYLDQLKSVVSECLVTCGGTWATCEACVTGKILDSIAPAAAIARKCVGKLTDRAQVIFNQAQSLAEPTLAKIPEVQAIATEILTGFPAPVLAPVTREALPLPPIGVPTCFDLQGQPIPCPIPTGPGPTGNPDQPPAGPPGQPGAGLPPEPGQGPCGAGMRPTLGPDGTSIVCQPPPPPPPTCPVVPPTCPSGFVLTLDQEAQQYICKPNLPNCPPPTTGCPAGFQWQWNGNAYACTAIPTTPPPPPPPAPGGEPSFLDVIGLTGWNKLDCPPSFVGAGHPDTQTIISDADYALGISVGNAAAIVLKPLLALNPGMANAAANALATFLDGNIVPIVNRVLGWLFAPRDCDYAAMASPVAIRAILSFVEHWLDIGLDDVITNLNYTIDRACPTLLPTQPATDAAYLGNKISFDTWKCWTRAINDLDVPALAVMESARTQPDVGQWISARLRDLIDDNILKDKLRGIGILDDSEADIFKKLAQQLPGPGDIVRFMVRNTEDPNIVAPPPVGFGLDAEYGLKFQGKLAEWAKGQGLTDDVMLRYWRAHWQIPSPTQLYTMLQRLRPDNHPNLQVTVKDVQRALGENDVLPFWRDRLIEIAYRLPRTSVAFDFFVRDIWGEPQLLDYYQNYGYNLDNAKAKVKADRAKRKEQEYKKGQLLTKSNVSAAFIGGVIGEGEARNGFLLAGLEGNQIDEAIQHASYLRMVAQRKRIMKSVKCQFVSCGVTAVGAIDLLATAGWDRTDAAYEVSCWKQQCDAKGKEATTAQLCKWYGLKLLTPFDYRRRLRRMGWSEDDAARIIAECEADMAKKASKNTGASKNGTATAN